MEESKEGPHPGAHERGFRQAVHVLQMLLSALLALLEGKIIACPEVHADRARVACMKLRIRLACGLQNVALWPDTRKEQHKSGRAVSCPHARRRAMKLGVLSNKARHPGSDVCLMSHLMRKRRMQPTA